MVKRTFSQGLRNFENKAGKVAKVASKALSIATAVAGFLNVETKNVDQIDSSNFLAGSIKTYLLNGISQGDTGNTRDGDQAKITRTYGNVVVQSIIPGSQSYFRVMLVVDKQADGSVPTIQEVLDVSASEPHHIAHNNMDNKFRFRILYDKVKKLTPQAITGGDGQIMFSYYKDFIPKHKDKMKIKPFSQGLKVRYSGTGNTASDIASNSLWLFVIADAATADFSCNHVGRTRYVDN